MGGRVFAASDGIGSKVGLGMRLQLNVSLSLDDRQSTRKPFTTQYNFTVYRPTHYYAIKILDINDC